MLGKRLSDASLQTQDFTLVRVEGGGGVTLWGVVGGGGGK
jgi:hypothetical protein